MSPELEEILAGRKIVLTETKTGMSISFDDVGTGRSCGACTLCCKLLPVPPLDKPAGQRCKHQRHGKGCAIYARRPDPCKVWSCRWLAEHATAGMPRPDRCHYVIDMETDKVVLTPNDGGKEIIIDMLQVWLDPAFPDAWDEPYLRAYIARIGEEFGMGALIRTNSSDAFSVFPPAISSDREWHIYHRNGVTVMSAEELAAKVAAVTHE